MRRYGLIVCAAVTVAGALATWLLLRPQYSSGQILPPPDIGPIPCQQLVPPPDIVTLEPLEKLGKLVLFDCNLSDPPATNAGKPGYACATCHQPEAGFASPVKNGSVINLELGVTPGIIPGRFDHRKPMSHSYAVFSPLGPFLDNEFAMAYVGGEFWDGRTLDLTNQAEMPFINPDEMANIPTNRIFPPLNGGYSALVAEKVTTKYRTQFEQAFGAGIIERTNRAEQYVLLCSSIAGYLGSPEVVPFSSKYDASKFGVPPQDKYTLSASEERGRALFFGKAICSTCHSSAQDPFVSDVTNGKETFSMYCYANIGVPKNPNNPFYLMTDCKSNPHGCNPQGAKFIDYGLGENPNPGLDGTKFFNKTPGDILQFRGLFKTVTVRNVDKRPYPTFVRAYMHNGVFKSLQTVVHFYNKRNIAVNAAGKEVAFDWTKGPPAGYRPLFPPPEVIDNVQNVQGMLGCIGNLGLTAQEEADLVAFLKILSDGFTKPNPVGGNMMAMKAKAAAKDIKSAANKTFKPKPASK
jgi:cytochrome c peroxidase